MGKVVERFKKETTEKFHPIDNFGAYEIEEMVKEIIKSKLKESEINYEIVDLAIIGSRSRGLEHPDSDLDVVVEVKANVKEYVLFNIFNEEPIYIGGICVDINPIREEETGKLKEYLLRAEKYLKNKEETK